MKKPKLSPRQIAWRQNQRYNLRKRRLELKNCPFYHLCQTVAAYNNSPFVDCPHCIASHASQLQPWPITNLKIPVAILNQLIPKFKSYLFKIILEFQQQRRN